MSQSSEQIEARLCAYLEGELDESGRAEIEKHLQQNPAHRNLLAEVARTRDFVRALPRETAPADLCETLQGQLERSVLLGDLSDEQEHRSMRIGRWQPMLAIAAMVVLAVGLGLVIYFGLPGGLPRIVAHSDRDGAAGGAPATLPALGGESRALDKNNASNEENDTGGATTREFAFGQGSATRGGHGGGGGRESGVEKPNDVAARGLSVPTTPPDAYARDRDQALAKLGHTLAATKPIAPSQSEDLKSLAQHVPRLWSPDQQKALFRATGRAFDGSTAGRANAALYLVVATAEPVAASRDVTDALAELNVSWEPVPESLAAALGDKAGAEPSAQRYAIADGTRDAEALKKVTEAEGTVRRTELPAGGADELAPAAPRAPTQSPARSPAPSDFDAADREPQSAPSITASPSIPAAPAAAGAESPAAAPPPGRPPTLILARNLTRQQAESLRTSLATRSVERKVTVWSAPLGSEAARELPAKQEQVLRSQEEGLERSDPAAAAARRATELSAGEPQVALRSARGGVEEGREPSGARDDRGGATRRRAEKSSTHSTELAMKDADARPPEPSPATAASAAGTAPDAGGQGPASRARNGRRGVESGLQPGEPAGSGAPEAQRPAPTRANPRGSEPDAASAIQTDTAQGARPADLETQPSAGVQVDEARPGTSQPRQGDVAAESDNAEEERVDLVIVVQAPQASSAPAGEDAAAGDDVAAGAPPATDPGPAGPIEKFEILTVTIGDGEPVNVRVSEDGTVDVPSAGRVAAARLSADELGERIAATLRRSNVDAKVTVTRPGAAPPASQPEEKDDRPPQTPAAGDDAADDQQQPQPSPPAEDPLPTPPQH